MHMLLQADFCSVSDHLHRVCTEPACIIRGMDSFRIFCLGLLLSASAAAQDYQVETVAQGLDHPWSLAFLPGGSYLVTEMPGQLRRITTDGQISAPLSGVPEVYRAGQGGLFDVVLHPGFGDNQMVFLSYAEGPPENNTTSILKARLGRDGLNDPQIIFRTAPGKDTPVHYGGRLAFLTDGSLLLTMGDGFDKREAAQSLDSHLGKTLRMTDSGQPVENPPFAEAPFVHSYGHRNPQGLLVDDDGTVFQHEHGPAGGDEVNIIQPGANYGWPAITHGLDYNGAYVSPFTEWEGMEQPLVHWTPSIAPSGMVLYRGELFPQWQGDLLVGALAAREVRRVDLDGRTVVGQETLFKELEERIRDVRVGPDGAVYLLTDSENGKLLKVTPAS